jgi:cell division septation protein DedD
MSPGRGVVALVLSVAALSAALVAGARFAGPALAPRAAGGAEETKDAPGGRDAGAGIPDPSRASDLSFYSHLGPARAGAAAPTVPLPGPVTAPAEPAPGGAWVVQALATRDRAAALRLRDRLAARGLPAVLLEGKAGADPVFRVRVGRYRDRAVADVVARRLRDEHRLSPWVLREDG